MTLFANGNVAITTANTVLTVGNTVISNAGISVGGSAINPLATGIRNRIINGAFDIWQRGTSFSVGGSVTYLADRWCAVQYAGSVAVFSQQTTGLSEATYCLRCQRNSGNTYTATVNVGQYMESINSKDLAGKSITLSFYARAGANFSASSNI